MSHFTASCIQHSQKTLEWVLKEVGNDGKLKNYPDDLTAYYKLPYLLTITGNNIPANQLLNYMKTAFFKEENILNFDNKKTNNPLMAKFWGYVLGWVAIASHKLGRFDISYPARDYLLKFQSQDHGGFATSGPWGFKDQAMDVITTSQLGRFCLYGGMKNEALKAGEFLGWNINDQSGENVYLFVNNNKNHIKDYPQDQEMIHVIKKNSPDQAYFMIGFPCAYLIELFHMTQNEMFLKYAKQYGDFALSCHESIKSFHFSHKVAWAMSLLYRATKEQKYLNLCQAIGEYLMQIQNQDGVWLKDEDAITSLDQSVENAIWLREIATNLSY